MAASPSDNPIQAIVRRRRGASSVCSVHVEVEEEEEEEEEMASEDEERGISTAGSSAYSRSSNTPFGGNSRIGSTTSSGTAA